MASPTVHPMWSGASAVSAVPLNETDATSNPVAELSSACAQGVLEKTSFGCCGEPAFLAALHKLGRRQVLVTGMEAHVCVYQTVLGLLAAGYHVNLVRDAICSRHKEDFRAGVSNAARAEFARLVTEQLASGSQDMTESLQTFMKSLPGQTPNMMESFQQAIATANQAFEQIAKTSTAAMNTVGESVKKAGAKRK